MSPVIIVKKLNTLKHLVRSTVATSHNCNSKYQKGDIIAHQHIWHVVNVLISNMGRGKFDTPPSKNPLTMVTRIYIGDYIGDTYHRAEFYINHFWGFVSVHVRLHTHRSQS